MCIYAQCVYAYFPLASSRTRTGTRPEDEAAAQAHAPCTCASSLSARRLGWEDGHRNLSDKYFPGRSDLCEFRGSEVKGLAWSGGGGRHAQPLFVSVTADELLLGMK